MKIAIVDDEKIYQEQLKEMLLPALEKCGIGHAEFFCYSSAEEFQKAWKPKSFHVVFLDIYMPVTTGVELAQEIRTQDDDVRLIFATTSNEFASESYAVRASFYLRKPYRAEEIEEMIRQVDFPRIMAVQKLTLPDGWSCVVSHILYTEYYNHSVTLHLLEGMEHKIYLSQKEMWDMLSAYQGFHAINRGNIINFGQVRQMEAEAVLLRNGTSLPVSRRLRKEATQAYTTFKLDRLKGAAVRKKKEGA